MRHMKHGKIFGMGNEWMCFIREGDFSSYMTKPISTLMFKHPEKIQFDLVKSSQLIQFMNLNLRYIMIKIKCYYYDKEIDYRCCSFLDEHDNELICFNKIFGAVLDNSGNSH